MDPMRLNLKLFAAAGSPEIAPSELAPIFHGWIQRRAIDNELLIDVADYSHVVDGPGVVLIGHEAHYAYDQLTGRPGFAYSLRRAQTGAGLEPALRHAMRQLRTAVALLEAEPSLAGRLRFDPGRLQLQINDRLLAPNEPATWARFEPDVRRVLGALFESGAQAQPDPPSLALFTLQIKAPAARTPAELLARA